MTDLKNHRTIFGRVCFCCLLIAGCAVGPDFKAPKTDVPANWTGSGPESEKGAANMPENTIAQWWRIFNDPMLTSLVDRAVAENLDLKRAGARIRQSRASRGIALSGIGPEIDASGSYERSRSPEPDNGGAGTAQEAHVVDQYQTGFDALWELDIFGGVRRSIESADADVQTNIEDRNDILVTLTAEVARNYMEIREYQERIVIARRNLSAQEHSIDLTRQRFQHGFVSGLDVANAEAQAATTRAQIPALEASYRQSIHSLSVLLGKDPTALLQELSQEKPIPAGPPEVPVGVPSDLLRRRPDIRKALAQVHSATAKIGVAESDLYPKFTISGTAVISASNPGPSFDWDNRVWSAGPSLSLPLFSSGRIRSNIKLQEALRDEDVIAYQQTILNALKEVEDALIASNKEQERRDALVTAVAANRKAVDLATTLYVQGETDFLNVLDAQRSLYSAEDSLAQSTLTVSTNLVALYKALGGGWEPDPRAGKDYN